MDTLLKEFDLCSQAGCEASVSNAGGRLTVTVRHPEADVTAFRYVYPDDTPASRLAVIVQQLRLETLQVVATR